MQRVILERKYNIFEFTQRDCNRAPGSEEFYATITNKSSSPRDVVKLELSELSDLYNEMNRFIKTSRASTQNEEKK